MDGHLENLQLGRGAALQANEKVHCEPGPPAEHRKEPGAVGVEGLVGFLHDCGFKQPKRQIFIILGSTIKMECRNNSTGITFYIIVNNLHQVNVKYKHS